MAACSRFMATERAKIALVHQELPEEVLEAALDTLWDCQLPIVEEVCSLTATTLAGHRARASAYHLFDGGDLAWRSRASGAFEDRLLAAIVNDLAGKP